MLWLEILIVKKNQPNSQQIEVIDIQNNTTTSYDSMGEAARALILPNSDRVGNYILRNQQKPYKGRYSLKKKKKNQGLFENINKKLKLQWIKKEYISLVSIVCFQNFFEINKVVAKLIWTITKGLRGWNFLFRIFGHTLTKRERHLSQFIIVLNR